LISRERRKVEREEPVIGFSTLSGREDLFSFANDLNDEGILTILAGPQDWGIGSERSR